MCPNVDSTVSTFCANVDIVNQRRVSLRWPFSLLYLYSIYKFPIQVCVCVCVCVSVCVSVRVCVSVCVCQDE